MEAEEELRGGPEVIGMAEREEARDEAEEEEERL